MTEPLNEDLFGPSQARDRRFTVADRWVDLVNLREGTPERTKEFLHRQMNEEVNVLEQAAQSLVDFPDEEWSVRKSLARQCADEARHARSYLDLMEERGVAVGAYPVLNFQYRVLSKIDSLIGRLAVENRTFEADGLDAAAFGAREAEELGDHRLATLLDAQHADELLHVGYALKWIDAQVRKDPANVMRIGRAMARAGAAFDVVFESAPAGRHPIAVEERRKAGFTEAEVAEAVRLSNERVEAAPPQTVSASVRANAARAGGRGSV